MIQLITLDLCRGTTDESTPCSKTGFIIAYHCRRQLQTQVFEMAGVQRARFCYNRKDAEATYFPADEALYGLKDDFLRDGKLDLGGWGIRDIDMPEVATVRNVIESLWENGSHRGKLMLCWGLVQATREYISQRNIKPVY